MTTDRRDAAEGDYPTLDDRNPASVVGVPWNEHGYAGGDSSAASAIDGIEAIGKILLVHSGEEFEAGQFPTDAEGREAWETWQRITKYGYAPGESMREVEADVEL